MQLATLQQQFAGACFGQEMQPWDDVLQGDSALHQPRLEIYSNNVLGSLNETLASTFEATQALVGEEFFNAMAARYIQETPPNSGCLYDYGAGFSQFIAGFEHAQSLPYLADVAALEWVWQAAYVAQDDVAMTPQEWAGAQPERLTLRDNVQLVTCTYPAEAIRQFALQEGETPELTPGTYHYLLHRPELDVACHEISLPMNALLSALQHRATLEEASTIVLHADEGAELSDLFAGLFRLALIQQPDTEEGEPL